MVKSHLYPGFRFAGRLQSVAWQRWVQARILRRLLAESACGSVLSVGCGFGDELAVLLSGTNVGSSRLKVTAIDLAPVEGALRRQAFADGLGSRLLWRQADLLGAAGLEGYSGFAVVQCGFVLHDVPYGSKEAAMRVMAGALHVGGYLIVSDIFLAGDPSRRAEVARIYDGFLSEAELALETGALSPEQWRLLVGDGMTPGLLRSRHQAMTGRRDFFETSDGLVHRATAAGLELCEVQLNPVNQRLQVLLMRRRVDSGTIDRASEKKDVLQFLL